MEKNFYIYDIRETLRQYTDDSDITNDHISFLIDDVRALLLRQKYKAPGSVIPNSVKQRLHYELELVSDNEFANLDKVLRTINRLPNLIESGDFYSDLRVDGGSFNDIRIIHILPNRFAFVGKSRTTGNVMYCTLGQDYRLYFKAGNPRHRLLQNVRIYAIFENPKDAWEKSADYDNSLTFEESVNYPIDLDMWVTMKEIILKQYIQSLQIPQDKTNNADEQ